MSGKAGSVVGSLSLPFLTFIFKFTIEVGQLDIAAFAADLDIEQLVLGDCFTMSAAFTLKYSFLLLLFLMKQ